MPLRFEVLDVSTEVRATIGSKHGVAVDEVLDALEAVQQSVWNDDPVRGRRLYAWGRSGHRMIFVALRPVDETAGHWCLVTAYPEA